MERLHQWEERNLPGQSARQAMALSMWLLKSKHQARPISHLYLDLRFSEPTLRRVVRAFVDHGLASIEPDPGDSRVRLIRGTDKLKQLLEEYRELVRQIVDPQPDRQGP
jgi:DNA-binding MarR family transcriptional regulator